MPYPFPQAGLFYQNGNGIVASLYRAAADVMADFGAKGTGVDDASPIASAIAYAQKSGIPVYFPPVNAAGNPTIFGTSRPLVVPAGVTLIGDDYGTGTRSTIRALNSMAYVAQLTGRALLQRVSFDGNLFATDGVVAQGAGKSRLDGVYITRALRNGYRNAVMASVPTVSATTQTGPGPAVTFSIPDPTWLQYGSVNLVCQVVASGQLDSLAAYKLSTDGGSTYSSSAFGMHQGGTQLPFWQGAVRRDSGNRMTGPQGNYQLNTTYACTITTGGVSANDRVHLLGCEATSNGTVYASSGLVSSYANFNVVTAPGTVGISQNSTRVIGNGSTTFLSSSARDGDMFYLPGAHFALPSGGTSDVSQIVCILGNGEIELDLAAGALVSGAQYAIGSGAGFRIDTGQSHSNMTHLDHCDAHFNPIGFSDQSLTGALTTLLGFEHNAFAGILRGTRSSD